MNKKLFFLATIIVLTISVKAQYSNATLDGAWFIEMPPANPYGDSLMYIVFDGNGNIVSFSGFCDNVGGTYSVSSTGAINGVLTCDTENFPMSGQLTSNTFGTADFGDIYNLVKVSNPGALATTLTGTLTTQNCGSKTISLTLDNNGIVTSSTGLSLPVSGRVYTEGGMFVGHFKSGEPSYWHEFSIWGYYSNNILEGIIGLETSDDCGNSPIQLTRSGITSIASVVPNGEKFSIYPNPAINMFTLNINNLANESIEVNIYNIAGKLVKSVVVNEDINQVDISNLSDGIYVVSVKTNNLIENQKLIIQR
jgi:hypothetical protein